MTVDKETKKASPWFLAVLMTLFASAFSFALPIIASTVVIEYAGRTYQLSFFAFAMLDPPAEKVRIVLPYWAFWLQTEVGVLLNMGIMLASLAALFIAIAIAIAFDRP